jgi:hypothetical protein
MGPFRILVRRQANTRPNEAFHFASVGVHREGRVNPDFYHETIRPEELPEFLKDQQDWVQKLLDRAAENLTSGHDQWNENSIDILETVLETSGTPTPTPAPVEETPQPATGSNE